MPETSGQPVKRPPTPDWVNALGKAEGLSTYTPTLREKVANYLNSTFYGDSREGQGRADKVVNWVETMVPPAGAVSAVDQGLRQTERGDYIGGGLTLAMMGLPAARKAAHLDGWHTSPHLFDKFEWSPRTRGTGEGHQMITDALYIAQAPEVSGLGGAYWDQFAGKIKDPVEAAAARALKASGFDRPAAVERMRTAAQAPYTLTAPGTVGHKLHTGRVQTYRDAAALLESGQHVGPHVYQTRINTTPDKLLDWDEGLKYQPQHVAALADIIKETGASKFADGVDVFEHMPVENLTGENAVRLVQKAVGKPRASEMLQDRGIPGVRFYDGNSRKTAYTVTLQHPTEEPRVVSARSQHDAEALIAEQLDRLYRKKGFDIDGAVIRKNPDATTNWAIHNASLIDILKKLGIALPAAGAAGMVAADKQKEVQ